MKQKIKIFSFLEKRTVEVEAEIFSIDGFEEKFGIHPYVYDEDCFSEDNEFTVTELLTGCHVIDGFGLEDTKAAAIARLKQYKDTMPSRYEKAKIKLAEAGINYPVNP